jgi:hypothetical protein
VEIPRRLAALSDDAKNNAEVVNGLVDDAQKAIDQVEQDEQVQAAQKLLNATILETTAAEQARLAELQRYLEDITRLRDQATTRDKLSICSLFQDAFANIYPATSQSQKVGLEKIWNALVESRRYDNCLVPLDAFPPEVTAEWPGVQRQWGYDPREGLSARRLDEFVVAGLNPASAAEVRSSTARLIAALGLLLFQEREMYEQAVLDLARERHRHSIRLSALNAGQRSEVVHQLAQGLAIYYEGGVKPEEIAQLMLLAGQVGGIFFIGSQL